MNKNLKLGLSIFMVLLFVLITVGSALAVEPDIEFKQTNWFTDLFSQGFYITGGQIQDTVNEGETVDATLMLRYKLAGDRTRLKLYWWDETGDYQYIGPIATKEYAYTSSVGDYIKVTAKNLNTNDLCPDHDNHYIKLAGIHEVRVNGVWKIDTVSTTDISKISSNFKMLCEADTCELEKGDYICNGNRVIRKLVDYDKCEFYTHEVEDCKSDEKCVDAKCIPDETAVECQSFDYDCSGTQIVAVCKTNNKDYNIDKDCADTGLVCKNAECVSDTEPVKEKIVWIKDENNCINASFPETNVPEDSFETYTDCIGSISNTTQIIDPQTNEQNLSTFDKIKNYMNDEPAYFWSIVILSILILSGIVYLFIPNKR